MSFYKPSHNPGMDRIGHAPDRAARGTRGSSGSFEQDAQAGDVPPCTRCGGSGKVGLIADVRGCGLCSRVCGDCGGNGLPPADRSRFDRLPSPRGGRPTAGARRGDPESATTRIAKSLGLPDNHLLLGMNKRAVCRFCAEIGYPDRYDRKKAFEYLYSAGVADSPRDWITAAYPLSAYRDEDEMYLVDPCGPEECHRFVKDHNLVPARWNEFTRKEERDKFKLVPADVYGVNGYDFVMAIRCWLHKTGNSGKSVAEVCFNRGDDGVGLAKLFISHTQSEPLESTLSPMPNNVVAWLDYVSLRQLQPDFTASFIAKIICHFRHTLAVEDAMRSYLTRAWCVLEVAVTPQGCLTMPVNQFRKDNVERAESEEKAWMNGSVVSMEGMQEAVEGVRGLNKIDVRAAKARSPSDLAMIHAYIHANGGFDVIDSKVTDALMAAGYKYEEGQEMHDVELSYSDLDTPTSICPTPDMSIETVCGPMSLAE